MAKKGKTTILPIGGLDSDSDARAIATTDYRYALNIRNGVAYINDQKVVTNVKGSVKVPFTLPAGTNKCIGSYEDKQGNSIIYFVWNSKHHDVILRYFPSDTTPFGTIEKLAEHNFGWEQTDFITGIDLVNEKLLYWTDRVMPRKLDIEKSALTGKIKTWNVYMPETITVSSVVNFAFNNMLSQLIAIVPVNISNVTDRTTIIADIATGINVSTDSPVTAEACDCSLKFTEKVAGSVGTIVTDQLTPNQQFLIPVIPDNWYGLNLTDRMADVGKWMPLYPPLVEFRKDENYEPNYVKNIPWQFRIQYQYDNFEESALGVISQIPINNLGCDGTSDTAYNYVYINFNEPELLTNSNLVLIKKVTIYARQHNEGEWRSIITLDTCDWLDTDSDGNLVCRYKFYGDIGGSAVDSALVAKQYDNVPITNGTQKFVKNRLNYGDVEIGRDAPDCIDAKPQVEFGDTPNQQFYEVTGKIRVFTYGLQYFVQHGSNRDFYTFFPPGTLGTGTKANPSPLSTFPFFQPSSSSLSVTKPRGGIFHDISRTTNNYPFFGGGQFAYDNSFGIRAGMEDDYDQRIPEGGWPVYAAGTDYFTISRQVISGLPTDSVGALDTSTASRKAAIGGFYGGVEGTTGADLYSTFKLLLPNGKYVIRLASHWCSFGNVLGKGFPYNLSSGTAYQKTSTNVWGRYSPSGVWVAEKEIIVTVNNGNVDIGDFVVMDIAPPVDAVIDTGGDLWQPICGYLYDSTANPLGQANVDMNSATYDGLPVEKALVNYGAGVANHNWADTATTDFNGYWFGIAGKNNQGYGNFKIAASQVGNPSATPIVNDNSLLFIGTLTELYTKTLSPINYDPSTTGGTTTNPLGLVTCLVTTDIATARQLCSTVIRGTTVNSNGDPVSNVLVVYNNGETRTSQINGVYELVAWGDMITPNLSQFSLGTYNIQTDNNRIIDGLIFELSIFCIPSYPNGQSVAVSIDPFGSNNTDTPPPYSPTAKYEVPPFIVNESNNPAVKARKRGGNYVDCIRLYDNLGRCTSPIKAYDLYLPFITEDIGKYQIEDFSGNVYPAGTFKYGKPSIKWVLNPNTTFPTWATKFQWMRTTNAIYGRYLQWVANQITYLSAVATSSTPDIETSFQNADAVAIKVSLSNITDYYAANNNSQISYSYIAGDRLRLIADRTLVNYSTANFAGIDGINDFEITSYDSTTQSVVIKPEGFPYELQSGMLFEIVNPKSVETKDGQLIYEVGEAVGITNGIPDAFSGVFSNGDTYWHGRLIIVNDDATKFASAYPVVIESASQSDFYSSEDEDIGRAATIDPNFKQLRYPTRMQCSNVYIEGSTINGLSSFESANYQELPREYGTMKRMFVSGQVLLTVHENKLVSNYIQLTTISDATVTDGLLAIADKYYGNNRPSMTDNGCQHGESCFEYNGLIWGLDARKGIVWQYDNNGDAAISAYKMTSFFKDFCVKGIEYCIPTYDKYRNELIYSIKNSEQTITIAYDNAKNRWVTFYSFKPEYFGAIGTNVVGFVDGELWALDKSGTYNNFFGQQYDSRITIVPNDNSDLNKVWDAVKLENLEDANKMINSWEVFNITNNNGQQSRILKSKFRKIEYFFYTSFLRDLTDVSVQNPILNGRELRSPFLIMEMKNDTAGQFQFRGAQIDYTTSELT